MARILADSGEELADVTFETGNAPLTLLVRRVVTGKGRLFKYFFSQGRRTITLESGGFRLEGKLATEWGGTHRLWRVRLADPRDVYRRLERVPAPQPRQYPAYGSRRP